MDSVIKVYETLSPEETLEVGRELGRTSLAGEVYALVGDLGVGKTVFTKGFAEGLGIEEAVNSPTFTILQVYEEGRLPLYHFDVYRIGDESEMDEIGFDDYVYGDGVCFIEWADIIKGIIPRRHTRISIERNQDRGYDYRLITITEFE